MSRNLFSLVRGNMKIYSPSNMISPAPVFPFREPTLPALRHIIAPGGSLQFVFDVLGVCKYDYGAELEVYGRDCVEPQRVPTTPPRNTNLPSDQPTNDCVTCTVFAEYDPYLHQWTRPKVKFTHG